MSSEEDDDEELLERALAQQAQRDQNYKEPGAQYHPHTVPGIPRRTPPQTPPNRAPPAPPPRPPPSRAPPAATMDDEEESDVELLSISSEDEDAVPPHRDGKGAGNSSKGRLQDDNSDLEWDERDQEPEKWTHVDQAELARRVREMREMRASVAVQASRMRRSSTIIDTPRGDDLLDPLGLGVVNIKTLTLVSGTQAVPPASNQTENNANDEGRYEYGQGNREPMTVRDAALRERVMYHSENFVPKFFLSHIHQNTVFSDLEAGEGVLRVDLQNRKDQLKKLVKENFDCFISCKNTIDDIHSKLQQIEADPEGAGTGHLSEAIQGVDVVAKRAFGPLLERQAQAERIRSVQGMLQRFRTLFNLPSMIRGYISKGEYDLAIREYKKAKSLVKYTHVGILSRVLEEVDKIVQEFKDMLYKTMENPNVETSQVVDIIRLLLELEPDSDPVWLYLSIQECKIRGLLEACSVEHEVQMDALQRRVRDKLQSEARWKQLQRDSNKSSNVDFSLLLGDQEKDVQESTGDESDALLGRLIHRLTVVLLQHLPKFWQLALLIFSGRFFKGAQHSSPYGAPSFGAATQTPLHPHENPSDLKFSSHSFDEVVTIVHCIISLYESKIQNAFLSLAEANVLRPNMREALLEITEACVFLQNKDCAPVSAVQAMLVLCTEVSRVFVHHLCTLTRGATVQLANGEDWVPVPTTERGGTPYAISYLPLRFRTILVATMEHMTEVIQKITSEPLNLLEDLTIQVHQMQDMIKKNFIDCFFDLADCLDKLGTGVSQLSQAEKAEQNGSNGARSNIGSKQFMTFVGGVEVSDNHQRLLMVLSNTSFSKNTLLPALLQMYQSVWTYIRTKKDSPIEEKKTTVEGVFDTFSILEEKMLNQYSLFKATEVGVAAADYLLDDGTQWGQAPLVKGVRDNVVELMNPLVAVHAEVYLCAKPFLDKVMNSMVEGLVVSLLSVFTDNKHKVLRILDVNGYSQLSLELDFLDAVLERYFTSSAREAAMGLRDMLLEKVCESVREILSSEKAMSQSFRSREIPTAVEDQGQLSADDVQAFAHQISADYLALELRRARINVVCFMESLPPEQPSLGGGGRHTMHHQKTSLGRYSLSGGGTTIRQSRKLSRN